MYVLVDNHVNIEVLMSQTGFKVNSVIVCPLDGADKTIISQNNVQ